MPVKPEEYHLPTYYCWADMKRRCNNPKMHCYHNYGGRGIRVCERWNSYQNFLEDMGEKPDGFSIERIDVNGDYCPENCIWIPKNDQFKTRRNTQQYTYQGKTQFIGDWCKEFGIYEHTLRYRIKKMSFEKALNTPIRRRR